MFTAGKKKKFFKKNYSILLADFFFSEFSLTDLNLEHKQLEYVKVDTFI